jgi:hypothetical protein
MAKPTDGEKAMTSTTPASRKGRIRALFPGRAGLILLAAFAIGASGRPNRAADITIYGRPMLVVSEAAVEPQPGREDSYPRVFDLKLTVSNIGSIVASHVVGTVPANEYVGAETGSAVFGFTYLYAGTSQETTLHLMLDHADTSGRVQPVIHFEYYTYDEEEDVTLKYTGDEPVRLFFGEPGWNRPSLLVESLTADPETPAPGDPCTLKLRIANVSAGDADQVLIRLGGTEGPKPFATVGAGNVGYIGRIPAHQTAEAEFALAVEGDAESGLFPIQVGFSYRNVLGEDLADDQVIYLRVQARPELQAGLMDSIPTPLIAGQTFELPVEVFNIGRQSLNVGTVELTSDDLTLANNSIYAGPLDGSTSTSLVADATAETAGEAEVTLTVNYLDEFNQPQQWTHTFRFTIEEAPAPAADSNGGEESTSVWESIWQAILAFLGFGG